MEIRQVLRGQNAGFAAARTAQAAERGPSASVRPSADRLELSRQWVEAMEEQRIQGQSTLTGNQEKRSNGILDMLDEPNADAGELDALSKQLDVQMKCMKIAANIMKGKKVPPEDERYLMENDPNGYKLALAMRSMVKQDDKECDSVLDDEDKESGGMSDSGETAPAENGACSGEAAASGEAE